jgi:hypothetical protein
MIKRKAMIKYLLICNLLIGSFILHAKETSRPIVNQAGYNLNEAKRFVCYGAKDGTKFSVVLAKDSTNGKAKKHYSGVIKGYAGDFTDFNPITKEEFVIKVTGHGISHPFWIADHLMEGLSSQLAYQFFIDVRGSEDPVYSNEKNVAGGGPSRDGGSYTLETPFEVLLYASNPGLFDRWHQDFNDSETPDLIKLILWHAEFAYHHRDYNGPTGGRPYLVGHPGDKLQTYDYQNTLDHLAAACAAYHSFLNPYVDEAKYKRYRAVCLEKWEDYERHQQVRYFIKSDKWVDKGWQEFNEMGNVLGQAILRNLFMYLSEKNEKDGQPEKFLHYAKSAAKDVIDNWDFNNPRHMWWIRNGEHITPQALAYFMLVAPEEVPYGTKEKLDAWATHMKMKTNNFWHYRKHDAEEWAHPRTKELGNTGLGGSMFLVAHLLDDPELRGIGWSQVNQVFGMNPAEAHYSNKSSDRLAIDGYWKGIEAGWPHAHPHGLGQLGKVRGTLDGTPLDNMFPYTPQQDIEGANFAYATEGWAVTNRAWMSTVIFSTLGSHKLKALNPSGENEVKHPEIGDDIRIQLKAALNIDWNKKEKVWINLTVNGEDSQSIELTETGDNTGVFEANLTLDFPEKSRVKLSYGHLGFEKEITFQL